MILCIGYFFNANLMLEDYQYCRKAYFAFTSNPNQIVIAVTHIIRLDEMAGASFF